MSADRELLELAAKAADYHVRCVGDGTKGGAVQFYMEPSQLYWNPLTDDGDALRLGATLMMELNWYKAHGETRALCCARVQGLQAVEFYTDDCMAATRRAIVRAAAEIGKLKGSASHGE